MAATLEDIEEALFQGLRTLHAAPPTDARPFRIVGRWAGEVTSEGVDEQTLGKSPSALLAYERSVPEVRQTVGDFVTFHERHFFRVYVTVVDTRGVAAATKGTVGQQGILRCTRVVKEVLAGLAIPGLADGDVVHLVDHRPWSIARDSHFTHVIQVSARAELGAPTAPATPGTPFVFDGHVEAPAPDTDGADVVLADARAPRD